jgi:Na+/phosphate symporter
MGNGDDGHIGDIIDKNLSELATKKIKRRFQFSSGGVDELSTFHKRTMDSLRIAFGVSMSGDVGKARKLLAERRSCAAWSSPPPNGNLIDCGRAAPNQ